MSSDKVSLEQVQRWMQCVLMHPDGIAEGMTSPCAREHLDVAPDDLESVILPSRALNSTARLEIYVNAYFERLLECVREEFTATRFAVGDELFDGLAFGYLQKYPSRSYTLNALGNQFPKFLSETRLHAHEMPSDAPESWPEFVIELAEFERILRDVFDGLGSEGRAVLAADQLSRISPDRWDQLRLVVAPCLRLHRFSHPVHEYWAAIKEGLTPLAPSARSCYLAVSRRNFSVERHELVEVEFELLSRIARGDTMSEALARATKLAAVDAGGLDRAVLSWFRQWTVAGFFLGCELPGGAGLD